MKYKGVTCDICGKDIGGDFQFRFRYWHGRIGTIHVKHMCQECYDEFKKFVKQRKSVGSECELIDIMHMESGTKIRHKTNGIIYKLIGEPSEQCRLAIRPDKPTVGTYIHNDTQDEFEVAE